MQNPFRKMEKEGDQHMPGRTFSLQPVNYTQNDERHDQMIMSPRQKLLPPKQEKKTIETKIIKASPIPRTWLGTKDNPRIVRVPRCFGGKDRHSKVYTIKGLRDRRIRLSVPTAIQLYDLQNRLGLNQPSKAVDWLLNATKHEIDKLPPLQVVSPPQTSFLSLLDATMKYKKEDKTQSLLFCKGGGLNINNNGEGEGQTTLRKSTHWNFDSKNKCKEVINEEDDQAGIKGHSTQFWVSNPFLNTDQSSLPSLLNNVMPYNSYNYHWDPSNLCLSHLGSHGYTFHMEDPHNYNAASLSSSLTLPYLFPPYVSTPMDVSPSLYSISPPMRPFQVSFPPKFLRPQNNSGSLSDKENCSKD